METIDPFFRNPSEKASDRKGTGTTVKETGLRQSKAII